MADSNEIREIIKGAVKGLDVSQLENEQAFSDAGIDSLDHSMILLAVEEKFKVKIPDEAVDRCDSVAGILAYLDESQA